MSLTILFRSNSRSRNAPLSPTPHGKINGRNGPAYSSSSSSMMAVSSHHNKQRPPSPMSHSRDEEKRRLHAAKNHRIDDKVIIIHMLTLTEYTVKIFETKFLLLFFSGKVQMQIKFLEIVFIRQEIIHLKSQCMIHCQNIHWHHVHQKAFEHHQMIMFA